MGVGIRNLSRGGFSMSSLGDHSRVTALLGELCGGNRAAADELFPLIYEELRSRARRFLRVREAEGRLRATEVVNEAYLRLVDQATVDWRGRTHFFAVAALVMRHVVVDHAREMGRVKRGGAMRMVTLDESAGVAREADAEVLALHEALDRLGAMDPRQARIVELRFFGGLSVEEVAEVLGVSKRTVEGEWSHAKAWLRVELGR
jgi:RNA polymerase sigma-70 factor, ECF subfamily